MQQPLLHIKKDKALTSPKDWNMMRTVNRKRPPLEVWLFGQYWSDLKAIKLSTTVKKEPPIAAKNWSSLATFTITGLKG